jgi:ADP-dependent NAD(P)H-hydrate dehydratase / NAD(P)H-hydrate epimerase
MTAASLAELYGALRGADVAALDAAAMNAGVDVLQLMEIAGFQVARAAWSRLGGRPARLVVAAGRGNNGGDGMVAARHLDAWGCNPVCVIVAESERRLRGAAATQLTALRGVGVEVVVSDDPNRLAGLLEEAALAVDALLGTGLTQAPRAPDSQAIDALNAAGVPVLAVDVPSGLDASTGEAPGACIGASATVTLTAVKAGLWTARGQAVAGDLLVADIGMPAAAWRAAGLRAPIAVVGGVLLPVPATTP